MSLLLFVLFFAVFCSTNSRQVRRGLSLVKINTPRRSSWDGSNTGNLGGRLIQNGIGGGSNNYKSQSQSHSKSESHKISVSNSQPNIVSSFSNNNLMGQNQGGYHNFIAKSNIGLSPIKGSMKGGFGQIKGGMNSGFGNFKSGGSSSFKSGGSSSFKSGGSSSFKSGGSSSFHSSGSGYSSGGAQGNGIHQIMKHGMQQSIGNSFPHIAPFNKGPNFGNKDFGFTKQSQSSNGYSYSTKTNGNNGARISSSSNSFSSDLEYFPLSTVENFLQSYASESDYSSQPQFKGWHVDDYGMLLNAQNHPILAQTCKTKVIESLRGIRAYHSKAQYAQEIGNTEMNDDWHVSPGTQILCDHNDKVVYSKINPDEILDNPTNTYY